MTVDYGQGPRIKIKNNHFTEIVLPFLVHNGWNVSSAQSLFNAGLIRIRPGRDYKEFTLFLTSPVGCPRSKVDDSIHALWKGAVMKETSVVTCFVNEYKKVVSSLAVTGIHAFANCGKEPIRNRHGQIFLTLPFSDPLLKKNIYGYNLI